MIVTEDKIKSLIDGKYAKIPYSLRNEKRWTCWKFDYRDKENNDGTITKERTKVPYNAITGERAKANDESTWCDFRTAVKGFIAYNFCGIAFMFGNGYTGIDLDNHPRADGSYGLTEEQFKAFADSVIGEAKSYAEWSPSGMGIHIIAKASLPEGRRRSPAKKTIDGLHYDVEMYDKARFFTVTGDTIYESEVEPRQAEIESIWKKYVDNTDEVKKEAEKSRKSLPMASISLSDKKIVELATASKNGADFASLYAGDTSSYHDDHSAADMALCDMLAFWTNGNRDQIDRIFRTSGLMRPKWDEMRGSDTYGNITLNYAINNMRDGYNPNYASPLKKIRISIEPNEIVPKEKEPDKLDDLDITFSSGDEPVLNLSDNGKVIFHRISDPTFFSEFNDKGNAENFVNLYGDIFHYNTDSETFMFWTGKQWLKSSIDYVSQYVDDFINYLETDVRKALKEQCEGDDTKQDFIKAFNANINRLKGTAGMHSMEERLKTLPNMQKQYSDFDKDEFLFNTKSGIVDIRTGEILPHDASKMQSMISDIDVSFYEPTQFISFLNEIFYRGDSEKAKKETKELINLIQQIFGLCLLGDTREQYLFIFNGGGSNGKSTLMDIVAKVLGDYCSPLDTSSITDSRNPVAAQNALAEMEGKRCAVLSETGAGMRLNMDVVKRMTGDSEIIVQKKYEQPHKMHPRFTPIMMTNVLPIISETNDGAWRRIVPIPFIRKFTDEEKDLDMPKKLESEKSQILGWFIEGYMKYSQEGKLILPDVVLKERGIYRDSFNGIAKFIKDQCNVGEQYKVSPNMLWKRYVKWCRDLNEYQSNRPTFDESIRKEFHINKVEINGIDFLQGIGIKQNAPDYSD